MSTFNPTTWAERYAELRKFHPPRGTPQGVIALQAELIDLYEQLVKELRDTGLAFVSPGYAVNNITKVVQAVGVDIALAPLCDLIGLARIGAEMRRAQSAYFRARKERPNSYHLSEYRHARQMESRFDAATHDTLQREQQTLPGMDAG